VPRFEAGGSLTPKNGTLRCDADDFPVWPLPAESAKMKQSREKRVGLAVIALSITASCVSDPQSDPSHDETKVTEVAYTVSADMGYGSFPQAYVDVAGSPEADFCRFVGDYDRPFLSCKIWQNGWEGDEYGYNSVDDIDLGYAAFPREFGDVNDDGLADYCRFVGSWPDVFLSCNLAGPGAFEADQYRFNSEPGIDLGYGDMPRELRDQNRDGLLDFCRFVGDRDDPSECCILANKRTGSFGPDQYICYSGPLRPDTSGVLIGGGRGSSGSGASKSFVYFSAMPIASRRQVGHAEGCSTTS
jgi:hypothetical protein